MQNGVARERWAFKDSRGTEFSFKRMQPAPRKARQLVASRRSWEKQSAKFHGECKSLVTVIPRDGTLIGNYAEQFADPGAFEPLRFPASRDGPTSLIAFAPLPRRHRHNLSFAISIPFVWAEGEKFLHRKIEIERDADKYRSYLRKCHAQCTIHQLSIVSQAASSPYPGYPNIQKILYIVA